MIKIETEAMPKTRENLESLESLLQKEVKRNVRT